MKQPLIRFIAWFAMSTFMGYEVHVNTIAGDYIFASVSLVWGVLALAQLISTAREL